MTNTRFSAITAIVTLAAALTACKNNEAKTPATEKQAPVTESPTNEPSTPSSQRPTEPRPGAGMGMDQMRANCPMLVEGTKVEVTDTSNGVALEFTTDKGDVSDLRRRVAHMAQMYEMHKMHRGRGTMWRDTRGMGQGQMEHGRGMSPGMGRGGMGPMPDANTKVIEIDRGARLILTPTNPAELPALRAHVRAHQRRMQSHECWMRQQQPTPPGETKQPRTGSANRP